MLDRQRLSTLRQENFEELWSGAVPKLNHFLTRRNIRPDDREDIVQSIGLELWSRAVENRSPPDFLDFSERSAASAAKSLQQYEAQTENQPPQYFAKYAPPFADVWGKRVLGDQWRLAEEYSLAPLEWRDLQQSIKDHPLLYYLSIGASLREAAQLAGIPFRVLSRWLETVRHPRRSQKDSTRLAGVSRNAFWLLLRRTQEQFAPAERHYIPGGSYQLQPYASAGPLPLPLLEGFFPQPSAPARLRKLRGYKPEWIAWFVRLSHHTRLGCEPITFGLGRDLSQSFSDLSEEEGFKFLIAATDEDASLLSQKFKDNRPGGEGRALSFSDIYELLRRESISDGSLPLSTQANWMDQILTYWIRTPDWFEMEPW